MKDIPQSKLIYVAKILHDSGYTGAYLGLDEHFKGDNSILYQWFTQLPFLSEIKPGQGYTVEIWIKPSYVPRECFVYLESMTLDDWERIKNALL